MCYLHCLCARSAQCVCARALPPLDVLQVGTAIGKTSPNGAARPPQEAPVPLPLPCPPHYYPHNSPYLKLSVSHRSGDSRTFHACAFLRYTPSRSCCCGCTCASHSPCMLTFTGIRASSASSCMWTHGPKFWGNHLAIATHSAPCAPCSLLLAPCPCPCAPLLLAPRLALVH